MIFDKDRFLKSIQNEVSAEEKPTIPQIELVKDMCYAFSREYPPDDIKTRTEYTKFISENLHEYKEISWDAYASYIDHYDNFGDRV